MSTLAQSPDVQHLAEQVRLKKQQLTEYKSAYLRGAVSYDELADAGKQLSVAMFNYAAAKFPSVKARKMPYQALIR